VLEAVVKNEKSFPNHKHYRAALVRFLSYQPDSSNL